jgi:hypothetical protein
MGQPGGTGPMTHRASNLIFSNPLKDVQPRTLE